MPSRYQYRVRVANEQLGVWKDIKGDSLEEVELKARQQLRIWAERAKREAERERVASLRRKAEDKSAEAQSVLAELRSLLHASLREDHRLDWDSLYDRKPFRPFAFEEPEPELDKYLRLLGVPKRSILETFIPPLRRRREQAEARAKEMYNKARREFEARLAEAKRAWESERAEYEARQLEHSRRIDDLKQRVYRNEPSALEEYVKLVLQRSKYPELFPREFDVQYESLSQTMVVDYRLPSPDDLPRVSEYRFSQRSGQVEPFEMKPREFQQLYESVAYQTVLRVVYEVLQSTDQTSIGGIVVNGWVKATDPGTGSEFRSCVASLRVSREEFSKVNLAKVDPRECFRRLKGLAAGSLYNLAPVKPILSINRQDKRFIESREVLAEVSSIPNLATMDWEDFEHLIRGLFERIFAREGAEVRVTRASRDWGVDTIAFDPDPIRGGKYVIQAKRYNSVVPVSAVRDLYGTVINEGATKGILVTTSYYGSESYEFAKDKPITLIDGSNLVYLFSQHGYNVRIELAR